MDKKRLAGHVAMQAVQRWSGMNSVSCAKKGGRGRDDVAMGKRQHLGTWGELISWCLRARSVQVSPFHRNKWGFLERLESFGWGMGRGKKRHDFLRQGRAGYVVTKPCAGAVPELRPEKLHASFFFHITKLLNSWVLRDQKFPFNSSLQFHCLFNICFFLEKVSDIFHWHKVIK